MILRILHEGQFEVDDDAAAELNTLDTTLEEAVERGDEAAFHTALEALLGRVRAIGRPAPDDSLEPSSLILPAAGATMDEVRKLLADDGLIPG